MAKFDILRWAIFGAILGVITSILVVVIAGLITGDIVIALLAAIIVLPIAAIFGAIGWIIIGLLYVFLLSRFVQGQSILVKLLVLLITYSVAINLLFGTLGLESLISPLISGLIIFGITRIIKLKLPFE